MAKKKQKIRASFRKNRTSRARQHDWTRKFADQDSVAEDTQREERLSGKGELTRKRTVIGDAAADDSEPVRLQVGADCRVGRVLSVHGLTSAVEAEGGE